MASPAQITIQLNEELVTEINRFREENNSLRMDLASLRPQLLKARQQRHEIHDKLRSAMHRIAELERLLP